LTIHLSNQLGKAYFRMMKAGINIIKFLVFFTSIVCVLNACGKKKKPSLAGDEKIEVSDFIESFPTVQLPFIAADSNLNKKGKDSILISKTVLLQFIPDSVLNKLTSKGTKYKAYAMGRVVDQNGANYLFLKTVAGDKKSAHLLTFNKNQQFLAAISLLKPDDNSLTSQTSGVDKRFSITKNIQQRRADGSVIEGKDVYVLNEEAKTFTLIMTDALGETVTELINPIDTLPRKHKYAADYSSGKLNLVSVRDGSKPDRIRFFVHIEKNSGKCIGEIKGEAFWKSTTIAEYNESGEACVLTLKFSSNTVSIVEASCGSKRNSIDCAFDGNFARQKYKKPSTDTNLKKSSNKSPFKTVKK
jgi:hypothetical protein